MLIDWFTVIAQVINFLILLVLLKFLLYDRIIRAMDQREEGIRARLEEAEKTRSDAEKEAEKYRAQTREFEAQREKMLFQAKEDADIRRKGLIQQARVEVEKLKKRWQEAVQRERESFIQDLTQMTGQQVHAIARRAFQELANTQVEHCAAEIFVSQIKNLSKAEAREIAALIGEDGNSLVVRSAFEMPAGMRRKISRTLHEQISEEIRITYETSPKLLMGIELKTQSRKISWSLDHYLETLEERARETLKGIGLDEEGVVNKKKKAEKAGDKIKTQEKPGG